MGQVAWIRRIAKKLSGNPRWGNGFFLDEASFRFEVARERMRSDRNGSPVAILFIELPVDRATPRDYHFLARVLQRRLRITDTAGVLPATFRGGHPRVGVLLPDTTKEGAWKVASDVCDCYKVGHDRPNCGVVVYPDDRTPPTEAERRGEKRVVVDAGEQLDALFAHPTPFVKRSFDVLGAALGLLVFSPLMAVLAAAVKFTSPGPVLFSQEREGHGGRRFRIYKFRSMRPDAHDHQPILRPYSEQDGPAFKMSNDPRTTWIGRLLRRTSLDELPQLWNVLVGDMSLVGPRPLPTAESMQCAPWQRQRLQVPPGLTCLWQVRGRSTVSFAEWMRMDLEYVRRRSFAYDLNLLLQTVPAVVFHRGPR
jgi:lipopolysaccharide/colanic/teichoic acid biosynthesis glycosyltransferase